MSSVLEKFKKSTSSCYKPGDCYHNFLKEMGVYVINCDQNKDRFEKFKKHAKKAGIKVCREPCISGRDFTDEDIKYMIDKGILKKNAEMTKVEVSINISHYNCWKRIVNSCLDYGLILEDDINIHKNFIKEINNILTELDRKDIDFSILHIYNGNWMKSISRQKKVLKIGNKYEIRKETVGYNAGAVAYIISKEYAEFLISKFFPIHYQQDILMGSYPHVGNHLTLKMRKPKKDCIRSPLFFMSCEGDAGTGKSTQTYDAPTIKKISRKLYLKK